LVIGDQVDIF